jgi:hypothetical protein
MASTTLSILSSPAAEIVEPFAGVFLFPPSAPKLNGLIETGFGAVEGTCGLSAGLLVGTEVSGEVVGVFEAVCSLLFS